MTMPTPKPAFDNAKAQAFAKRLIGALNEAALALMTSIGHRTGLFNLIDQEK